MTEGNGKEDIQIRFCTKCRIWVNKKWCPKCYNWCYKASELDENGED